MAEAMSPWACQDMEPEGIEHEHEPHEFDEVEKLAVAQAFYNEVGKMVSTKDPGSLRGVANAYYERLYEGTGAKSFDVKLLGYKVGTFSLTLSKPEPSKVRRQVAVDDYAEFHGWAEDHGFVEFAYDMPGVDRHFAETGELPPGCRVVETVTPAVEGGKVTRTTLRVDNEAVLDALGPRLEAVSTLLLEGGE